MIRWTPVCGPGPALVVGQRRAVGLRDRERDRGGSRARDPPGLEAGELSRSARARPWARYGRDEDEHPATSATAHHGKEKAPHLQAGSRRVGGLSNGYPDAAVPLAHSSSSWEMPPAVLDGRGARARAVRSGVRPAPPARARPITRAGTAPLLFVARRRGRSMLPLVSPLDAPRRGVPPLGAHAPARADRRRGAGAAPRRRARAAPLLPAAAARARVRSPVRARSGRRSRCSCVRASASRVWALVSPSGTSPRSTTTRSRTRRVHDLEHLTFVIAGLARLDPARRPGAPRARCTVARPVVLRARRCSPPGRSSRRAGLLVRPALPRYARGSGCSASRRSPTSASRAS